MALLLGMLVGLNVLMALCALFAFLAWRELFLLRLGRPRLRDWYDEYRRNQKRRIQRRRVN